MNTSIAARLPARSNSLQIAQTVALTFLTYLTIGLPLGVLPTHVSSTLGLGAVLAGFAVSSQYIATIVSRAKVGEMTDRRGAKLAVTVGFLGSLLSSILTLAAATPALSPLAALGVILVGRLALGIAESWVGTGAITWAIGLVGPTETVRIISWNGIASYGGIAVGAPIGVALDRSFGFWSLGAVSCAIGALGLVVTLAKEGVPVVPPAEQRSGRSVLSIVFSYGCALALATSGFGVIAAFITLLFASHHWQGGSLSLSLFGFSFIAARLIFSRFILRYGGLRVGIVAMAVEAVGLIVLWAAPVPALAMIGAGLTGFGFAPVFPAIGVVAVGRVPESNRGAAIGLFSVFFDLSLGVTGPVAGLLVERFGTASPFLLAAAAALAGLGVTAALLSR